MHVRNIKRVKENVQQVDNTQQLWMFTLRIDRYILIDIYLVTRDDTTLKMYTRHLVHQIDSNWSQTSCDNNSKLSVCIEI